jgi:KaiC/GvpD/RAD55 family RecA-like ATPase
MSALECHQSSKSRNIFALCGLGGMGKTQIAVHFVYRHRNDFDAILWVHADTETKLLVSFKNFAVELGFWDEATSDQAGAKTAVIDWLQETGKPRLN